MEDGRTRGVGSGGEGPSRGLQVFSGVLMSANFYRPDVVTPSRARGRAAAAMGKISRIVMPKGGRRGKTGLKGKIHRSVSRVPVKKTIVRDRAKDYHGVDKLEAKVAALEAEEEAGWVGCNALIVKTKQKELKHARAKLMIKDAKHER